MAYNIDVLKDNKGNILRPATITDNVVNPNSRKSVTEEFSDLEQGTNGLKENIGLETIPFVFNSYGNGYLDRNCELKDASNCSTSEPLYLNKGSKVIMTTQGTGLCCVAFSLDGVNYTSKVSGNNAEGFVKILYELENDGYVKVSTRTLAINNMSPIANKNSGFDKLKEDVYIISSQLFDNEHTFTSSKDDAKFLINSIICGKLISVTNIASKGCSIYFYDENDSVIKYVGAINPGESIDVIVPNNAKKIGGYASGGYSIFVKTYAVLPQKIEELKDAIKIKRNIVKWFNFSCDTNGRLYSTSNRLGLRNIVELKKGSKISVKPNGQLAYLQVFSHSSSNVYSCNSIYSFGYTNEDFEYIAEQDCGYYIVLKKADDSDISPNEAVAVVEETCYGNNVDNIDKVNIMPARSDISLSTYIDLPTGNELPSVSFGCTPQYLSINPLKSYKLYSFSRIGKDIQNVYISMYDDNKSFICSLQLSTSYTTESYGIVSKYRDIDDLMLPLNARYIRVSADKNEILGIAVSEDYSLLMYPEHIIPIAAPNMVSVSRLGYNSLNARTDLPKYPQGQIVSFIAAKNAGFDTILFNVLYTKDDVAVVSHDVNIATNMAVNVDGSAISSSVKIPEHTFEELQMYDYGLKYGEKYRGLKLLTLDDALKWARMANVYVDIEISSGESKLRINSIADKIKKYGLDKQCMFFSYNVSSLVDIPNKLPYAKLHVWGNTSDEDIVSAMNSALSLKNATNHVMVSVNYPTIPSEETINTLIDNGIGFSLGNVADNSIIIELFKERPYLMYTSRVSTYVEPISVSMQDSRVIMQV